MAGSVIESASGGKRGKGRRRAVMSEINVTPFVDVMLVLLIVFMVSAPLMTMAIKVDLPQTGGATALNSDKEQLIVSLKKIAGTSTCTSQAELYLGQNPITPKELAAKLQSMRDDAQLTKNVLVNADKDVCYDEVARILGRLRQQGFGAALKTEPPKQDE